MISDLITSVPTPTLFPLEPLAAMLKVDSALWLERKEARGAMTLYRTTLAAVPTVPRDLRCCGSGLTTVEEWNQWHESSGRGADAVYLKQLA